MVSPYDCCHPGGVATHISYLSRELVRKGHEVKIYAPCSNRCTIVDNGVEIIPIGGTVPCPSNGSVARFTLSVWLMPQVKTILERENFDIIHLHEPLFPSLPWMVIPLSHTTNIGTFHAYYDRSVGYWFWRPVVNIFYNRLHGKIAVSESAKKFVSRYYPGDYHVVPHGVDLEHFSTAGAPLAKFDDGKLNILFVSRLEKRKGLFYLLQAYEEVKREFPQSRLIVVGSGDKLQQKYEEWVAERKLQDVVFAGYVSYDDLPRYYHTADIFCAPAIGKESFGIILLEAMAAGKPIVASDIEGYADVISRDVDGILVPPRDSPALAQALLTLIRNSDLRCKMGTQGRGKAEWYTWEAIAQRTIDCYQEAMKNRES